MKNKLHLTGALVALSLLALPVAVHAAKGADDKPAHSADDKGRGKNGADDKKQEDQARHGADDAPETGDDKGVDLLPHVHGGGHR